jgi:Zn finger protein HypA/HybF involved in hydrogenase expression
MSNKSEVVIAGNNTVVAKKIDNKVTCPNCQEEVWSLHLHKHCPKCGSHPDRHEIRNYSMMWHDGDIHCVDCGTFVRDYDAG